MKPIPLPRSSPRLASLMPVVGAALFTAAVFLLLPALETVSARPEAEYRLREAAVTRPPPPELPVPREETVAEITDAAPVPSVPTPREAPPPSPPAAPLPALAFSLSLDAFAGDAALSFPIEAAPPALAAPGPLVFEIGQLDQVPSVRVATQPLYPPAARLRRQEGEVRVEFVVDAGGLPREVVALDGTPPGVFEDAAVQAVKRWRFEPGRLRGAAVDTRVRQKIMFRMDEP